MDEGSRGMGFGWPLNHIWRQKAKQKKNGDGNDGIEKQTRNGRTEGTAAAAVDVGMLAHMENQKKKQRNKRESFLEQEGVCLCCVCLLQISWIIAEWMG